MARSITVDLPLRNLREQSGVSLADMAEILTARLGRTVKPEYVRLIESRGTDKYVYISAYSDVSQKHISLVADAAKKPENKLSK